MRISLKLVPATHENFQDFGTLLMPKEPDFSCAEFDWHENLATLDMGKVEFGQVVAKNIGSFEQKTLERHTATKEVLIPAKDDIILVLGKGKALEAPYISGDFAAFYVKAGWAVALHEGIWHQGPMCFVEKAPAFVLYAAGTGANDKQVVEMADLNLEIWVDRL